MHDVFPTYVYALLPEFGLSTSHPKLAEYIECQTRRRGGFSSD